MSLRALCVAALAMGLPSVCPSFETSLHAAESAKEVAWTTDFPKAQALAKQTKRPIFMLFTGSDWCKWCVKLEREVFEDPDFIEKTAGKYVFVMVDRPRRKKLDPALEAANAKLCDKYQIDGYPTVLILNPAGDVIGEVGYEKGGGKGFLKELNSVLGSNGRS
jgi:protein disulfide-isomerase